MSQHLILMNFAVSFVIAGLVLGLRRCVARPGMFFAQTVAPDFLNRSEGRAILGAWRVRLFLTTTAALLILIGSWFLTGGNTLFFVVYLTLDVLFIVALFLLYQNTRAKVTPYRVDPPTQRRAGLGVADQISPTTLFIQSFPYLFIVGTMGFLAWRWDAVPEVYAAHMNLQGEIDRYASKSFLDRTFIALAALVLMLGIHIALNQRYRAPGGMKRLPAAMTQVTLWYMAGLFALIILQPLVPEAMMKTDWFMPVVMGGVIFSSLMLGVVMMVLLSNEEPAQEGGDFTKDEHWRGGGLYRNPEDGALFVEKRFGMGYTINVGHPDAKLWIWGFVLWLLLVIGLFILPALV